MILIPKTLDEVTPVRHQTQQFIVDTRHFILEIKCEIVKLENQYAQTASSHTLWLRDKYSELQKAFEEQLASAKSFLDTLTP